MTYGTHIQFVDRESGETLNGHLMPEAEEAWGDICQAIKIQMAGLTPGQYFEVKIGKEQNGRFTDKSVTLRPPQIHPVRRKQKP